MNDSQPVPSHEQPSQEQTAIWNGPSGRAWAETQDVLDRILQPFEDLLLQSLSTEQPQRVLDVGCGTGSTTLAFARRLGPRGSCTGIDISEPMLSAARARVTSEPNTSTFMLGDAENYPFEPAAYDAIVSRFGVMFFRDSVRAFNNLRQAVAPGAPLSFVAWRSMDENEFMTVAERTAAPLIPNLPKRHPDEPGQFAFADGQRVRRILSESGWAQIEIRPVDVPCSLLERDLMPYVTRFGPVGRILHEVDERTREQFLSRVRAAFEPYIHGSEVRFTSACWLVGARA